MQCKVKPNQMTNKINVQFCTFAQVSPAVMQISFCLNSFCPVNGRFDHIWPLIANHIIKMSYKLVEYA